ncbi:MAG: hypothetical protein BroJett015_34100 [Chloroflexota bacterium]|nr:MAG: hypothetical protein BroJett015_34100 [Chloroflexota bacterium]
MVIGQDALTRNTALSMRPQTRKSSSSLASTIMNKATQDKAQCSLTAEQAAARLREVSEVHYRVVSNKEQ